MILLHCRKDAENQSQHPGKDGSHDRKRQCVGKSVHDHLRHRAVILVALPHIAAEQTSDVQKELLQDRPVKVHGFSEPVNRLLVDMLAEQCRHRVAGHDTQHNEDQQDDAQQYHDCFQ